MAEESADLVVVVDDDREIRQIVSFLLGDEGFRVVPLSSGRELLERIDALRPDIVLLDLGMPDLDGVDVLKQLRTTNDVPVILVTGRGRVVDRVGGLEIGADDYLTKPFDRDELAARVRAVLRRSRSGPVRSSTFRQGDLSIDFERRLVRRGDTVIWLGRTEWELLQLLVANAGRVVLSTDLLTRVWGEEYAQEMEILRNCVSRLRRKLQPGDGPSPIRTYVGVGYALEPAPDAIGDEQDAAAATASPGG